MFVKWKIHIYRGLAFISMIVILAISLTGCTPDEECTDIRLKIEEDGYLTGWVYVKNISSLDNESNPTGRISFALYVNEENIEEYAVLKIVKLTIPNKFNGSFVNVTYDDNSNTAKSLDKESKALTLDITYDSEIVINSE